MPVRRKLSFSPSSAIEWLIIAVCLCVIGGMDLPFRPAAALLSKKALAFNFKQIRDCIRERSPLHHSKAEVMAVVKADAYGHDLKGVLPQLRALGVRHFAVASLEEAARAREISKTAHIIVLGGTLYWTAGAYALAKKLRVDVVVNDLEAVRFFSKKPDVPIHLKLDTGMNRLGLKPQNWGAAIEILKRSGRRLDGLLTHFATFSDRAFERQTLLFEEVVRWFYAEGFQPRWVHSENSAALFSKPSIARRGILSDLGNLVRPGIALYGYLPAGVTSKFRLDPVLELVSQVGIVKEVDAGEGVSYGHRYRAPRRHVYGVVPLGYADGLSKEYAEVLNPVWRASSGLKKGRLNICGSICMDMVMVRSKSSKGLQMGDRVVFWGRFPNPILAEGLVEAYELNLRISKRIPRIWVA